MLEATLSLLIDLARKPAARAFDRNETIQRVLNELKLPSKPARDDFESIFIHTLIQYGINKPEPILNMWRNDLVRDAFRESFGQNNPQILVAEIDTIIERQNETGFLGELDYDLRLEIDKFSAVFFRMLDSVRTPLEIKTNHKLDDIQQQFPPILERLDHLVEEASQHDNRALQKIPSITTIPVQPPKLLPAHYTQRAKFTERLRGLLSLAAKVDPNDIGVSVVLLIGIGGSGKTTLCLSLTNEDDFEERFPGGTLWVDLTNSEISLEDRLRDLMLTTALQPDPSYTKETMISLIRNRLAERPSLLVLDDASDASLVSSLLECLPEKSASLVTSRLTHFAERLGFGHTINVEGLLGNEARSIVESISGKAVPDSDWAHTVEPLLSTFGFHPLSVALAAAQVSIGEISWEELLASFEAGELPSAIDFANPTLAQESLEVTFGRSIDRFPLELRHQFQWLGTLAMGKQFALTDAAMIISGMPEQRGSAKTIEGPIGTEAHPEWIDEQKVGAKAALSELVRWGVLQRFHLSEQYDLYQFHTIIQSIALNQLREQSELNEAVIHHAHVYTTMMLSDAGAPAPIHAYSLTKSQIGEVLERAWARINDEQKVRIETISLAEVCLISMTLALSNHWSLIGENDERKKWTSRALSISQKIEDKENEFTLRTYLARSHFDLAELAQADYHYAQAMLLAKEIGDKELLLTARMNSAQIGIAEGRSEHAVNLLLECLEDARKLGDKQTIGYLLGTLAQAYLSLNHPNEALKHQREAVRISVETRDLISYGMRVGNLGSMYLSRAETDIQNAIQQFHTARIIGIRTGNVRSQANHLVNLARAHHLVGDQEMALACIDEAILIVERILPDQKDALIAQRKKLSAESATMRIPMEWGDIFENAEAAVRGDRISELRLRRFIDELSELREEVPELYDVAKRVETILDGERDPSKIMAGYGDDQTPHLYMLLLNLQYPGITEFLVPLIMTLLAASAGDEKAQQSAINILETMEERDPLPEESSGLKHMIRSVIHGESNPTSLTSHIKGRLLRDTLKRMLSSGPLQPVLPDHLNLEEGNLD